ncbi:MFS transporter [Paeniglutamicibacter cryotolerans]|uniref:Putative MFS family arabinose efflux permease n=1 Tax=Paeniglutamicibacter cryotolerans TaxID=670079 RepID=A0A839QL20_9MICC|nr:MFS transporter [Paeniglutamicibacter cryotolerans]MBB2996909.1 putative MFS family arabinose efflux permease [Paeniglutamicibacter cryotolerans]
MQQNRQRPTRPRIDPAVAAWRNAIFGVFMLCGVGFATWVARLPAVREGMALSTADVGILLLGLAAGSIIGLAFAPGIMVRLGNRGGLRASLSGIGASAVLLGITTDMFEQHGASIIALALFGFCFSVTDVLMNVEGAAVEKACGRTLLPLMHAFFSFGTILGALAGAGAAALRIPVVLNFSFMGVAVAATGLYIVRFLPPSGPVPAPTAEREPWGARMRSSLAVARDPSLALVGLMVAGMAFAEGSANDWLPIAAVDGHGFDEVGGALVYGVFVAAMTVGRVAGGPLIDALGRRRVLLLFGSLGLIGVCQFIFTTGPTTAIIGAALWGLGCSLGFPVGISVAADHPTDAARRVSVVAMFGYSAFLAGPPIIGFLGEHFGILNAFLFVAAMLTLTLLLTPRATRIAEPEAEFQPRARS